MRGQLVANPRRVRSYGLFEAPLQFGLRVRRFKQASHLSAHSEYEPVQQYTLLRRAWYFPCIKPSSCNAQGCLVSGFQCDPGYACDTNSAQCEPTVRSHSGRWPLQLAAAAAAHWAPTERALPQLGLLKAILLHLQPLDRAHMYLLQGCLASGCDTGYECDASTATCEAQASKAVAGRSEADVD